MSEMSDSEYRQKMKEHLASFGITDVMSTDFKPIDENTTLKQLDLKKLPRDGRIVLPSETTEKVLKFINAELP